MNEPELKVAMVDVGKVRVDIYKGATVNDLRRAQNFISKIVKMLEDEALREAGSK